METIVDRIQIALDKAGMKWSPAAIKIGLSAQAATNWKKGKISKENVEKLADLLNVDVGWLLTGNGSENLQQDDGTSVITWESPDDLDPNKYVIIPHVEVKFSAGNGHLAAYEPSQRDMGSAHLLSWVHKKKVSPKNLMTVDIDGDSMEPNIKSGSVVMLDKSINTLDQIQSGKVYAIRYGNELKIKRLSRRFDGALIIDSDNPQYQREIVEADQLEHISIIGKYVSHTYDGEI
ncbi:LexA family transcriptional regulator [Acinetobacter wuhouensis]|uniref:XRE family transcriptional regulator n=1 Tax=Acinetobacter wuhouensis TaxID=1879050 RepID=UPI001022D5E4|nr:LexA family transcriptional regulator [Acinetobacter wuhouensis]RZG71883.1 LexA family transcriptional regulator [Acinetobacter wuhouensis]